MSREEITFAESEVEPIIGRAPRGYAGVVVPQEVIFDETEVEPIVVPPPRAGYQGIVAPQEIGSAEAEGELILAGPYADAFQGRVIEFSEEESEPIVVPVREFEFAESEAERIVEAPYAGVVQRRVIESNEPEAEDTVAPIAPATAEEQSSLPYGSFIDYVVNTPAEPPEAFVAPSAQPSLPLLIRPPVRPGTISWELADAWNLPPPSGMFAGSRAERQVLSWLQAHANEIIAAERRWRIDRRAIAAAIAWEGLENVTIPFSVSAAGPGKVHVDASVVEQVERRGLLPARTSAERRAILRTISGAIEYIGAIMSAMADIAESFGYNIRCNAPVLTNEYQARDLTEWTDHLVARENPGALQPGNRMGLWTQQNLFYVEFGVGTPDPSICSGTR